MELTCTTPHHRCLLRIPIVDWPSRAARLCDCNGVQSPNVDPGSIAKLAAMAFNFQPTSDSSDEDEVDISAWQGSAPKTRPQASAPVAPMHGIADNDEEDITVSAFQQPPTRSSAEAGTGDDEDDQPMGLSIDGESETPQLLSANRTPSQNRTFATSGFTSINRHVSDVAAESDDVGLSARSSRSKSSAPARGRQVQLVPAVRRNEVDIDDYEDFTQGGDVVLKVSKEMPSKRGMVRYLVELGDNTLLEVYSEPSFSVELICTFRLLARSMLGGNYVLFLGYRVSRMLVLLFLMLPILFPTFAITPLHFAVTQL